MVNNNATIVGRPSSLRQAHRSLALRELLDTGGISRTQLTKKLGLSQMATTRIIRDLIEAGLVVEAGQASRKKGPGRRQTLLKLRGDGLYTAGIVITAYATQVSIISITTEVIQFRQVVVKNIGDCEKTIAELAQALNDLIDDLEIPRSRIAGVSLAIAANIDPESGAIFGPNYLGWDSTNLKSPLEKLTKLPIVVENIVCARGQAETLIGAAKGQNNIAVLNIATTTGSALFQDGQLIRGKNFKAGRVGHFQMRSTNLTCSCGNTDCLNCSSSGWSILNQLNLIRDTKYNPKHVTLYSQLVQKILDGSVPNGEDAVRFVEVLKNSGKILGKAIKLIDQLVEPETIILTGSLMRVPHYLEGVYSAYASGTPDDVEIEKKIHLGTVSAARAAAIPALLKFIYSPRLDFENLCLTTVSEDLSHKEHVVA